MKKLLALIAFIVTAVANCTAQNWISRVGIGFSALEKYVPILIYEGVRGYNIQMENIHKDNVNISFKKPNMISPIAICPTRTDLCPKKTNVNKSTSGNRNINRMKRKWRKK